MRQKETNVSGIVSECKPASSKHISHAGCYKTLDWNKAFEQSQHHDVQENKEFTVPEDELESPVITQRMNISELKANDEWKREKDEKSVKPGITTIEFLDDQYMNGKEDSEQLVAVINRTELTDDKRKLDEDKVVNTIRRFHYIEDFEINKPSNIKWNIDDGEREYKIYDKKSHVLIYKKGKKPSIGTINDDFSIDTSIEEVDIYPEWNAVAVEISVTKSGFWFRPVKPDGTVLQGWLGRETKEMNPSKYRNNGLWRVIGTGLDWNWPYIGLKNPADNFKKIGVDVIDMEKTNPQWKKLWVRGVEIPKSLIFDFHKGKIDSNITLTIYADDTVMSGTYEETKRRKER